MQIYIEAHGCKRRYVDISKFHKYFMLNGYSITDNPYKAHYILLVTCAFKKEEEDYSLKRVSLLKKHKANLLIYGCLPDIAPSKLKEFQGIIHLAPRDIDRIDTFFEDIRIKFSEIDDPNIIPEKVNIMPFTTAVNKFKSEFEFSSSFFLRAIRYTGRKIESPFLNINNTFHLFISKGCMGDCSYCAIKRAIGSLKSKPVEKIISEFRKGLTNRYKDFVLLGDDVGAYGRDMNSTFPILLSSLMDELNSFSEITDARQRNNDYVGLHIEEIHPKWIILYENKLLNIIETGKVKSILCPIQSGSDRILKLMKRYHDTKNISNALSNIRLLNPGIYLSTQIIVGFPTETENEFDETLYLLSKIKFDSVIIFPYHEKENTPAAELSPKVPEDIIQKRIKKAQIYLRKHRIKPKLSCQ